MSPNRRQFVVTATTLALAGPALAQPRPLRLVVPYPPGGPLDIVARALAERVKDTLGTVIVDNRPGAGGNLGADLVAKAAPDGQTIVMGAVATHAINPWLYGKLPYDPVRDFTPITLVAQVPNVVVLNADTAARLRDTTVALFTKATEFAESQGVILCDTKFEFGTWNGALTLIDEALTPDSSRYWDRKLYVPGKSQPSFDKQPVRDWLERSGWNKKPPAPELPADVVLQTTERYREIHRRLTGEVLS